MSGEGGLNPVVFWRLWKEIGKAVYALCLYIQSQMLDSHAKGKKWEQDFKAMAKGRKLVVQSGVGRADMVVAGKRIQAKAIDRCENGRIDIANMRGVAKNGGYRGYLRSEIDVYALRHSGVVYLIPADYLAKPDGTLRNAVRRDELEPFRDAWHVFDAGFVPPVDQQGTLPLGLDD